MDSPPNSLTPLARVIRYHEQTKHDFNHYARSLGYLDWANQPDPFRRFHGAPCVPLPILGPPDTDDSPAYRDLYVLGSVPPRPLTVASLSRFLEYALSITAWKAYGNTRWALRSNPSSGNLHPTEGYIQLWRSLSRTLPPGLYHYAPQDHALEQRGLIHETDAEPLQAELPMEAFVVGLTSVHWREAWKYGERAFRYCQHDVGHAIGTLRIAAACLGWRMMVLDDVSDDVIAACLGVDRDDDFLDAEPEHPDLMAIVWVPHDNTHTSATAVTEDVLRRAMCGHWQGKANRLSRDKPTPWEIIDDIAEAARRSDAHTTAQPPRADVATAMSVTRSAPQPTAPSISERMPSAHTIIHQRRSAVEFDGTTELTAHQWFNMLSRVMPVCRVPLDQRLMPWDSIAWEPAIHLALFVHRVNGVPPGLYFLERTSSEERLRTCQQAMHTEFVWDRPPACPPDLPLYLLKEDDMHTLAKQLSCWQDIAKDGAFSLAMIAEFDDVLATHGPWAYRRLFWETGMIGQVLYLEAEAAGIRATGIGCFFDNPVHRLLGIYPHTTFQSLYHFTMGGPVHDDRLTTLPPYSHEQITDPERGILTDT